MTASLKNYFNYLKMNHTRRKYEKISLKSDCTSIASANERGIRFPQNTKPKLHEQSN